MVRIEQLQEEKTAPSTVAALFVRKNGPYFGVPGVDPWDRSRNAMDYAGPYPVVAHPPCARWCRLAGLVWGLNPDGASSALVSWCGNHVKSGEVRKRVGKDQASKTPQQFRDVLISIARSSKP